jgi:hypothetical protein
VAEESSSSSGGVGFFRLWIAIGIWWYVWGAKGFWWGVIYGLGWEIWVGYKLAEHLM